MKRGFYVVSMAVLVAAAVSVPLPLFVIAPGLAAPIAGSQDAPAVIEVEESTDSVSGQLLLTAVGASREPALDTLLAVIDPNREVVSGIVPSGVDREQFDELQRRLFDESVRVAAAAGLQASGLQVTVRGGGARVEQVMSGTPAEDAIEQGDVIVEAAGERIRLSSQLLAVMARQSSGDRVPITVQRGDDRLDLEVRVRPLPGTSRPGLGVLVSTVQPTIELPVDVRTTDALNIGGQSAGLMIALTVHDLTDPADLTRGRRVAGTGTIDLDGRVGEISGVRAKVVAATRAGADVFLAPASQADEARRAAPDDLTVIGVDSLQDAIARLGAG